jgi:hypothetical protein
MYRFSINAFTNDAGKRVAQPHLNGQPLSPETDWDNAARIAWDAFGRTYGAATMTKWDGDTGETIALGAK